MKRYVDTKYRRIKEVSEQLKKRYIELADK